MQLIRSEGNYERLQVFVLRVAILGLPLNIYSS